MSRDTVATPCPARPEDLESQQTSEPTEELNYTTEIQAALRQAAPRRRTSITSLIGEQRASLLSNRSVSLKIPSTKATTNLHDNGGHRHQTSTTSARLLSPRRRISVLLAERIENHENHTGPSQGQKKHYRQDLRYMHRKPRRQTIYIPSDDTTIFTIHPGVKSDTSHVNNPTLNVTINTNVAECKRSGVSLHGRKNGKKLAAAPKRAPLQPTLKPLRGNVPCTDMAGAGPGKENKIPAWSDSMSPKARRVSILVAVPGVDIVPSGGLRDPSRRALHNKVEAMTKSPISRGGPLFDMSSRSKRNANTNTKRCNDSIVTRRNSIYYGPKRDDPVKSNVKQSTARLSSQLAAPVLGIGNVMWKDKYPFLSEDIDRTAMFEDTWLEHQQFAIQQLINGLFEAVREGDTTASMTHEENRRNLLHLYQTSKCSFLYERIHASLLYGALSPAKSTLAETLRLRNDVGLRRRLVAIWTGSYNLETLSAAAEVVIGRQINFTLPDSCHREQPRRGTGRINKKELAKFLDSCLLRNEDASEHQQQSLEWCWRRTLLRSLMMIWLMDRAKETAKLVPGNLYRASSRLKSSRDILTELCSLLLPFTGDVYRELSHLEYSLHHTQFPISEYEYSIRNLATDLRDGVRLARLAEILMYPLESTDCSENTTVVLPTGEQVTNTVERSRSGVLSQHLKFPCVARAHKVYNVQIALSALREVRGVGQIIESFKAEDIVDGHRERTVTLLWGLVGKCGLAKLVDFEELRSEISRLRKSGQYKQGETSEVDQDDGENLQGLETHAYLLKEWAKAIAARHGLRVLNLTTSFADGHVFGKIIDEYQAYLFKEPASWESDIIAQPLRLESKLRSVGCSASFGKRCSLQAVLSRY